MKNWRRCSDKQNLKKRPENNKKDGRNCKGNVKRKNSPRREQKKKNSESKKRERNP